MGDKGIISPASDIISFNNKKPLGINKDIGAAKLKYETNTGAGTDTGTVIENGIKGGRRRRSSAAAAKKRASARRVTKKRASARRGRRRQRHSRRSAH